MFSALVDEFWATRLAVGVAQGDNAVAEALALWDDESPTEFRQRLTAQGMTIQALDIVHYLPLATQAGLAVNASADGGRQLESASDAAAFAEFQAAAPPEDLDDAYVELDHWAVFGVFVGERLVAAASAYPWRGSTLADIGVITLPEFRGQGRGRTVVQALAAHCLAAGHEPQYRCDPANTASVWLGRHVGFLPYATWAVLE